MKVNKWISIRKGALRGLQYAAVAVAALNTVPVPDGVGVSDQATIAFAVGAIGAVFKAVQNYRKVSKAPMQFSGYKYLVVAGLSVAGLAGCITTTAPDGTTTTQVDGVLLETALTRYDRHVARKELLEEQKRIAKEKQDAERLALIQEELDRLEPEIRALGERLGLAGE